MEQHSDGVSPLDAGIGSDLLRSILATVPDAMIVIDADGSILSFSAAAERMFRYTEAELLGRNVSMLMPSPDRQRHDGYIGHYMKTGERRIIGIGRLTTARRRDGSTFPIELSVGEVHGDKGRLFTGFIRDLTETQRAERRLQDLQAEIAQTSRVTAMGTLAATLAHEINQPLTAIANYLEAARDLVAGGEGHADLLEEALAESATQAQRAGEIIRSLREFLRRGETERKEEGLRVLLDEAAALALIGSSGRGVELEIAIEPDVNSVMVNRIQIQQVITNLARNAVEVLADRPIRILRIAAKRREDGKIEVTVEDNGPGLPDSIAQRLFTPFSTTRASGMGLGLSICQTIVEAHGGRIWTDRSELGGAAFHFTLDPAE